MKIKKGYVIRKVMGNNVVIATGEASRNFHGMVKLNDTAAEIWGYLAEGLSEEDICKSMLEKYTSYTFKDKTNKRITCHKLRSTYASNLLEETHDPSLVANTLGHNSLEVVSRYGKVKELDRGAIDIRTKK